MTKYLRGQLAQQLRLVGLRQFLEDGVDALAASIADGTDTVSGHGAL